MHPSQIMNRIEPRETLIAPAIRTWEKTPQLGVVRRSPEWLIGFCSMILWVVIDTVSHKSEPVGAWWGVSGLVVRIIVRGPEAPVLVY